MIICNLANYSKTTHLAIHNVTEKEHISKHVFVGKHDHKASINTRLEFLTFLATHSAYKIGHGELNSI